MAARAKETNIVPRSRPRGLGARLYRAATSRSAKTAYVAVGAMGLAAPAVAIFGSSRLKREIVQPMRETVSDQAEKLWSQSKPLRAQLGELIAGASTESGREKLVRSLQSWIGHFRAS